MGTDAAAATVPADAVGDGLEAEAGAGEDFGDAMGAALGDFGDFFAFTTGLVFCRTIEWIS